MNDYEVLLKFILIGDSNVGKSCLLLRLIEGRFKNQHEPTLGVQFGSKIFNIQQKKIKLQIWDTAGQESFKSITRAYYKGSIGALLVFDITSQTTFKNVKQWLYEIKTHSHQKMKIVLIGNKSDLSQERQVTQQAIQQFIKQNSIEKYYQTSALKGTHVEKPFLELGQQIMEQIDKGLLKPDEQSSFGIKIKAKKSNRTPIKPIASQPLKLREKQNCAC